MEKHDEVSKQIRKDKLYAWLSIIFFGLCAGVGLASGQLLLFLGGFAFVVGGIWVLYKQSKLSKGELEEFVPNKSHRSWIIKNPDQYRAKLTKWQIGLCISAIIFMMITKHFATIGYLIAGLIGLQVMKSRIKIHTPIDDASLFELEERGIISSKELVKGLYKDFESWKEVKQNAKLLILTQDKLISIIFNNPENAVRTDCRLKDINKLGISSFQDSNSATGNGLIIYIGTKDNELYRIRLLGASYQDSPEMFMSQFVKTLDESSTQNVTAYSNDVISVAKSSNFRNIDIVNNSGMASNKGNSSEESGRYIDL